MGERKWGKEERRVRESVCGKTVHEENVGRGTVPGMSGSGGVVPETP